jgi:hypothetical protein
MPMTARFKPAIPPIKLTHSLCAPKTSLSRGALHIGFRCSSAGSNAQRRADLRSFSPSCDFNAKSDKAGLMPMYQRFGLDDRNDLENLGVENSSLHRRRHSKQCERSALPVARSPTPEAKIRCANHKVPGPDNCRTFRITESQR